MRQLYEACVTPIVDYASTVWHDPLRDKTHLRHLRTVERAALIRVLSAFRTLAKTTLDVEAHVLPTHLRLRYLAQNTITRLHTLPRKPPISSGAEKTQQSWIVRPVPAIRILEDNELGETAGNRKN